MVRRTGRSRRGSECRQAAVSFFIDRAGHREQRPVSDEARAMIVTKKQLPRRTVLRAVGAAVSLPLLDAMVPALTAQRKTAAAPVPRLGFIYTPNGYMRQFWVPKGTGRDWEVTRSLQALAPYR